MERAHAVNAFKSRKALPSGLSEIALQESQRCPDMADMPARSIDGIRRAWDNAAVGIFCKIEYGVRDCRFVSAFRRSTLG